MCINYFNKHQFIILINYYNKGNYSRRELFENGELIEGGELIAKIR